MNVNVKLATKERIVRKVRNFVKKITILAVHGSPQSRYDHNTFCFLIFVHVKISMNVQTDHVAMVEDVLTK